MPVTLVREMGLTHADFFRHLPGALVDWPYRIAGLSVTVGAWPKQLFIRLAPERERRIAALSLPITDVSFEFCDFKQAEVDAFMKHLDRYYQRGGG